MTRAYQRAGSSLNLHASTGIVNLRSDYLAPSGPRVPVSVSADTGSISMDLKIAGNAAVSLSASNSLGSISDTLPSFTISQSTNNRLAASVGNISTASTSFVMTVNGGTGSIDINEQVLS